MRLLVLMMLLMAAGTVHAAQLRDVRASGSEQSTRVVFELDQAPHHKLMTLDNPSRVVVDLYGVDAAAVDRVTRLGPRGMVQSFRSAMQPDGALRVVMTLEQAASAKSFVMGGGANAHPRLVIDLLSQSATLDGLLASVAEEGGGLVSVERTATPPASAGPVARPLSAYAPPSTPASAPASTAAAGAPIVADSAPIALDDAGSTPATPSSRSPVALAPPPSARSAQAPLPGASAKSVKVGLSDKRIIVAIDAGHGGNDPGAIGQHGAREKDVTLAIARRLAKLVDQQPGMKAVLIRDADVFIPLRERTRRARSAQADIFVSIHANAYKDRSLQGSAVYVLSSGGASNEHARWLAQKENEADLVGGIELNEAGADLATVLLELSQDSTMQASMDLGQRMLDSMARINRLQRTSVQEAGFMVLKSPDIPSVLVETAFISNQTEEKQLSDPTFQERVAKSLLTGLMGYFEHYRPQQPVVQTADARAPTTGSIAAGSVMAPQ